MRGKKTEKERRAARLRAVKLTLALLVGLTAVAACGYFFYLFFTISFLPFAVNITVRILLVLMGVAAAAITAMQVKNINAE